MERQIGADAQIVIHSAREGAEADNVGMNHTQLSKLFKKHAGYGISEFINKVRIEAAKKLLGDPSLTLKEIASRVGYSVKKHENVTPRNFGKG